MALADPITEVSDALDYLSRDDDSRPCLCLIDGNHIDAALAVLFDALIEKPDFFTHVFLNSNRLTDVTGLKLACYVSRSSRLEVLEIRDNEFTDATPIAIARAAHATRSLCCFSADVSSSGLELEIRRELGDLLAEPSFNWWVTGPGHHSVRL